MKAAISIPDDIFLEADKLARRLKRSRSDLYSQAIREYLCRHSSDQITETINHVLDEVGVAVDPFVQQSSTDLLRRVKW